MPSLGSMNELAEGVMRLKGGFLLISGLSDDLAQACRGLRVLSAGKLRISLALIAGASLITPAPVRGDVVPDQNKSLGTLVEKVDSLVQVKGGSVRGKNRFHRFQEFDTRDQPQGSRVVFRNEETPNVFMGVLSRTFIDKPVLLNEPGNLYLLSPMGITLGRGVSFTNIDSLTLSTAAKIQLGSSFFDYDSIVDLASADFEIQPSSLPESILSRHLLEGDQGALGMFESAAAGAGSATIELDPGVTFTVDQSLLVVANNAPIQINSANIGASGREEGQGLFVVGRDLSVDNSSLHSNKKIVLREPTPVGTVENPVDLSTSDFLGSPVVSSNCATAGGAVGCNALDEPQFNRGDTLSNLL